MSNSQADNEVIAAHEPPEGKWTKKARRRVGRITKIEHEMFLLKIKLDDLSIERQQLAQALHVELTEMKRAGEPETGWSGHWRAAINDSRLPILLRFEG